MRVRVGDWTINEEDPYGDGVVQYLDCSAGCKNHRYDKMTLNYTHTLYQYQFSVSI